VQPPLDLPWRWTSIQSRCGSLSSKKRTTPVNGRIDSPIHGKFADTARRGCRRRPKGGRSARWRFKVWVRWVSGCRLPAGQNPAVQYGDGGLLRYVNTLDLPWTMGTVTSLP
jgi:hypothetical protein